MSAAAGPAREPLILLGLCGGFLAISAIRPWDWPTWWMEVAPILIGVPILVATWSRFRFTPLTYRCLLVHAVILMIGAHWSYARVPLGDWLRDALDLGRNNYDKVGHFAQGFFPALVTRELLLGLTPLRRGGWLFFLVASVCLALSAVYEFIEWGAAVLLGQGAEAFLGTQGYVWDTQSDMLLALVGAILAQLLLGPRQDRELAILAAPAHRRDPEAPPARG